MTASAIHDVQRLGSTPEDARRFLARAMEAHHPRIALACSFSVEDIILMDLLAQIRPDARVFSIDTGRLPEETYEVADAVRQRFSVRMDWFFPATQDVECLETGQGLYSFRNSLEQRRACCYVRKVLPLRRALDGLDAWITGLRREHGPTRQGLAPAELDIANGGILKLSPLLDWTGQQTRDYAAARALPLNRLYDAGYASIGCAPCTRPILPGQDERAGRWWWEAPEHKECGLHPAHSPGARR